jgi:hypothetical protein
MTSLKACPTPVLQSGTPMAGDLGRAALANLERESQPVEPEVGGPDERASSLGAVEKRFWPVPAHAAYSSAHRTEGIFPLALREGQL